jgi:hypothetical protein
MKLSLYVPIQKCSLGSDSHCRHIKSLYAIATVVLLNIGDKVFNFRIPSSLANRGYFTFLLQDGLPERLRMAANFLFLEDFTYEGANPGVSSATNVPESSIHRSS